MPAHNVLALDVGQVRVGLALARDGIRVPIVLTTLARQDPDFWDQLAAVVKEHNIGQLVVGLPRGLDGQETEQTNYVRAFKKELSKHLKLPVSWQDEALTSVKAEAALRSSARPYKKTDIDGLSASFILGDYLER